MRACIRFGVVMVFIFGLAAVAVAEEFKYEAFEYEEYEVPCRGYV